VSAYPSSRSMAAIASPIPEEPPVTSAEGMRRLSQTPRGKAAGTANPRDETCRLLLSPEATAVPGPPLRILGA
jgi:hypothetical protein